MPNSLNTNALNQYAARFTATVLNEAYRNQAVIKGPELLKLTPVRQVNLGILNRLFDQWKNSALAFRSIYFDFESEEVKTSLQNFMNTVSQHIAVKRNDLEPLFIESVKDTITLLYTPESYFEEKLRAMPESTFTAEKAQHLAAGHPRQPLRALDPGQAFAEEVDHLPPRPGRAGDRAGADAIQRWQARSAWPLHSICGPPRARSSI